MSTDAAADAPAATPADIDIAIQAGAWKDRRPSADERAEASADASYADRGKAMADAERAEAAYRADPMGPGNTAAFLAAMEAARDVALAEHRRAILSAADATKKAVALAGPNAVAREQAKAKAMTENARWLGEAEAAAEAAGLAYDRAVVDVARTCKIAEVRIAYAKERIAERERAGADILMKANPFSAPAKIKITESEYASITDPAMKRRAASEAIIVPDPPVTFTRADAARVLASRGSFPGRRLLTMDEFRRLPEGEKSEAARTAILFDE